MLCQTLSHSGQISDSGKIYGYTGYTEICCIHCGWAEYTYKEEVSRRPREYFDRMIIPYDEALIAEKGDENSVSPPKVEPPSAGCCPLEEK